jgi:hypothetical protein
VEYIFSVNQDLSYSMRNAHKVRLISALVRHMSGNKLTVINTNISGKCKIKKIKSYTVDSRYLEFDGTMEKI